ncbi:MAG TPA: PTS fructose transporter subunit IIC, partial [Terriglobales bacterium]|nr:PTS fructose transporter subunit IIC [Terriglobales bacterium]
MLELLTNLRRHLLTGVSFAIPFIACGGILIASAITFAPMTASGPDFSHAPGLKLLLDIGAASFALMLPVLAGYISYSIAGKPGLLPGFLGGYLSGEIKAGFLGAMLVGLVAGYVVEALKKIPVPKQLRPVMPILVIPILSGAFIGVLMKEVLGAPIAALMEHASAGLRSMSTGNSVLLALLLGAMIAFDMGGPVNKTAFFFGAAMIREGNYQIMGACAAAICTPPLGMGVATLIRRRLWTAEEREAGLAGIAMGLIGITEGAIPFA